MKKMILALLVFVCTIKGVVAQVCDEHVARILARTCILASPLSNPQNLANFIDQYRNYFVEGGAVVQCAQSLGARLVRGGAMSYDPKAYERAMEIGPPQYAEDVARSINSGSVELMAMGQELLWLSQVLPAAANGNWGPFLNTGTSSRQSARQYLPLIQFYLQGDPEASYIFRETIRQILPFAEEQIIMLAIMLR